MSKSRKLIVICGPTASGKSDLAMNLAADYNGEIVIADSRQIYRRLDIGTSKPTPADRAKIPHHLIDICEPGIDFSAAQYKERAARSINDIQKRKRLPFMVGGTGLYIDSITKGLNIPAVPPDEKLRTELEKKTAPELLNSLQELDPEFADTVDKNNKRRLIRAIEVCKKTGRKFSQLRTKSPVPYDIIALAITWSRQQLYARIDKVIDKMIADGLRNEVTSLIESGVSVDWLKKIGLEYRFMSQIISGETSEAASIQRLKYASHQFAKRQLTWFRKDKKITWLEPDDALAKSRKIIGKNI